MKKIYEIKNFEKSLIPKLVGYGDIKIIQKGFNKTALSNQPFLLEVENNIYESKMSACTLNEFNLI